MEESSRVNQLEREIQLKQQEMADQLENERLLERQINEISQRLQEWVDLFRASQPVNEVAQRPQVPPPVNEVAQRPQEMAESSRANQREEERLLKQPALNLQEMEAQPNDLANTLNEILEVAVLPQMSTEQCIYKVPQRIRQINPQAYTPQIIAIGPFHHPLGDENKHLQEMENIKLRYFSEYLKRTDLSMNDLRLKLEELQIDIRNCYEGHVRCNRKDLLNIITVDACFIIEHFHRRLSRANDSIISNPQLLGQIERDLLLLENQLPFYVLEKIYNLGYRAVSLPFIEVTMRYFEGHNHQSLQFQNIYPRHFTDLLRTFFLPTNGIEHDRNNPIVPAILLYSASQLSEAGLEFQLRDNTCLFDMDFVNGVLHMPCFNVSDTIEAYMKNLLAFEECHISDLHEKYISQYIHILDFLIKTKKDVSILVDKKIIVHKLGDDKEVATMVNTLCKNISMPNFNKKFIDLSHGLNGFYENSWQKKFAILKHEYFGTARKTTVTTSLLILFALIIASILRKIIM